MANLGDFGAFGVEVGERSWEGGRDAGQEFLEVGVGFDAGDVCVGGNAEKLVEGACVGGVGEVGLPVFCPLGEGVGAAVEKVGVNKVEDGGLWCG